MQNFQGNNKLGWWEVGFIIIHIRPQCVIKADSEAAINDSCDSVNLNSDNVQLLVVFATEATQHKVLTGTEPEHRNNKNSENNNKQSNNFDERPYHRRTFQGKNLMLHLTASAADQSECMWGNLDVRATENGAQQCARKSGSHAPSKVPIPVARYGPPSTT